MKHKTSIGSGITNNVIRKRGRFATDFYIVWTGRGYDKQNWKQYAEYEVRACRSAGCYPFAFVYVYFALGKCHCGCHLAHAMGNCEIEMQCGMRCKLPRYLYNCSRNVNKRRTVKMSLYIGKSNSNKKMFMVWKCFDGFQRTGIPLSEVRNEIGLQTNKK